MLINKRILAVLLVVLFLIAPSTQHSAENMTDGQIVPTGTANAAEQLPLNPQSKDSWNLPRSELLEFLFEELHFKNVVFALRPNDRIILYTDGIVEASNTAHVIFGLDRCKEFIKSHAALPAAQFADAFIRHLFKWSGKPSEEALD